MRAKVLSPERSSRPCRLYLQRLFISPAPGSSTHPSLSQFSLYCSMPRPSPCFYPPPFLPLCCGESQLGHTSVASPLIHGVPCLLILTLSVVVTRPVHLSCWSLQCSQRFSVIQQCLSGAGSCCTDVPLLGHSQGPSTAHSALRPS